MRVGCRAAAFLVLLLVSACSRRESAPDAALRSSIEKGLACVAERYDGNSFRDEYLGYEYPGEAIESPLAGYRLTYRILDAYFIVLMIRQAGIGPGAAGTLFERAESVTAALVPLWRRKGIYNLRRDPVRAGIALDTYAILAVLRRDPEMGRVVAAGLDGDGWLAADFYSGDEAFRRLADESWAARALLVADPSKGLEALRGIFRQSATALDSESDPLARANLVIHAMEALGDLASRASPGPGAGAPDLGESERRLREEGYRLLRTEEVRHDTLTFGNLLGALVDARAASGEPLAPHVEEIIRRQDAEGCWSVSLDPADRAGRVFATLRMVLTLGRYESFRRGRG